MYLFEDHIFYGYMVEKYALPIDMCIGYIKPYQGPLSDLKTIL